MGASPHPQLMPSPPCQPRNPIPKLTPNPSPAPPPQPQTAENGGKNKNPQHRQPHPAATQPQPRAVKAHNRNPMPDIHHTNQTRQPPPFHPELVEGRKRRIPMPNIATANTQPKMRGNARENKKSPPQEPAKPLTANTSLSPIPQPMTPPPRQPQTRPRENQPRPQPPAICHSPPHSL